MLKSDELQVQSVVGRCRDCGEMRSKLCGGRCKYVFWLISFNLNYFLATVFVLTSLAHVSVAKRRPKSTKTTVAS